MGMFDGNFPSQKYLGAVPVRRKVSHVKAAAAALNNGMRLTSIEQYHRAPAQGDSMTCRRKMQIQALVLT